MQSHEIDYHIKGHDVQLVEIELDPNETVIAEAGAMLYMDEGINYTARMGDGSTPNEGLFGKLLKGAGRLITGESLFVTHFTNQGYGKKRVAFSAPYPGTIIPLHLQNLGYRVTVQRDAFLCAALGTKISVTFSKRLGSGLFGGEGFILQKLEGDGLAFVHAGGTVIEKELNGESLFVDTGCLVGFTDGIDYNISQAGGLRSMVFGGEGLFLAHLRGTGKVWLQSMPISKLIAAIAPAGRNSGKETGGLLGNLLQD
ncbi:TIGR00266 family protein [Saccharicrinis sp. FJH62]|uniref:TIGR00266 family protein n=1 Tax=Saccharicrinis sp. FJH62 TaxID=3344657 RepID=UPI0035D498B6